MKIGRSRFWSAWMVLGFLAGAAAPRAQVSLSIGTIQPGQEVVITYEVTLDASLLPAVTHITSQGVVSGAGFSSPKSTDDPETGTENDATVLTLQNDAPVVAAGDARTYAENASPVTVAPGLTVSDVDNISLAGATVSITVGFVAGDTLSFADQNGISGSYNSSTGVLGLSGVATVFDYQTALASIGFASSSDNPTSFGANPGRVVSFVVNDGTEDSAAATATIDIIAENDAPAVTAGNTIDYTENGAPIAISPGLSAEDPDSASFAGASVSITAGFVAGDILGFANQGAISGDYAAGVLTLSGAASVAEYQAALRSVSFSSTSDDPTALGSEPTRTIAFVVNDGTLASVPAPATINVSGVNDNPPGGIDTIFRGPNDDVKVKLSSLLANDSDIDGGTLSITSVSSSTPGGAAVKLSGDWIFYAHAGTLADSFTYTLSDGQGGSSLVLVNVVIQGEDTQAGPVLVPVIDGGLARVTFHGIPGRTYTMQSAPTLSGPWIDTGVAIEGDPGHYTHTENAILPVNFYRTVYRP